MQIPILQGVYTDNGPDFRTFYPRNMVPVPTQLGISQGYLRPSDGLIQFGNANGPGIDNGGVNYHNVYYRVMGTNFCRILPTGVIQNLGSIGATKKCSFAESFDYLAISTGTDLYYFDAGTSTLTQVVDPDLGTCLDVIWIDGYFMSTDGEYLVVTELNAPLSVAPLKYGSSEIDPDPIVALMKLRNEVYAVNRYTIEIFQNRGGNQFPFQRAEGAQIQKGAIGTHCVCVFNEMIAFIGSGRNESPGVYLAMHGTIQKLSTREIDLVVSELTETQLSDCILEARVYKGLQWLYVHLPDRTLVYDNTASQELSAPVWFVLTTSPMGMGQYAARSFVWVYEKWHCGHPTLPINGYLDSLTSYHYGALNEWEINSSIVYSEGKHGVFHEIELVCLQGRIPPGANPVVYTSYSLDGLTWSVDVPCAIGTTGQRFKKVSWLQCGPMWNWRTQRFKGNSDAHVAISRLEARIEATL